MADIKLFRYQPTVKELKATSVLLEKELQTVIENNMPEFFGVTFLASEYVIDGGRMDSIGIDENNCPVIFEYKRSINENVINQGLFYLNWLLEHKDSFELLVLKKLNKEVANNIDWSMPRVICIAGDFNKYDEEAIKQINRNVSLIRYKKFDNELIMFELLNSNTVKPLTENGQEKQTSRNVEKTFSDQYKNAPEKMKTIYDDLKDFTLSLGDDVTENTLKFYTAFKKIKNFITMEIYQTKIVVNLKLNPDQFALNDYLRDVRNIGHYGCGDLQYIVKTDKDLNQVKELIEKAYKEN